MSFMSILTISRGTQAHFISTKRRWFRSQYLHHRFIVVELDNAKSIHAFNRFEAEPNLEHFQCHFSLVDLARHVLYTLGTFAILD